jgi:hypothetical protein
MTQTSKAYMDTASIVFTKYVREMTNYKNFRLDDDDNSDSMWPTIAIAINVLMEMHSDDDYFIGAIGVLLERMGTTKNTTRHTTGIIVLASLNLRFL